MVIHPVARRFWVVRVLAHLDHLNRQINLGATRLTQVWIVLSCQEFHFVLRVDYLGCAAPHFQQRAQTFFALQN
jgi:hypothetical protein